jgi:phosphatidate cytidylyltransferase
MKLRALTALALIPPVVYLAIWSPVWLFVAVLLLVVERTAYEYFGLSRAAGFGGFRGLGYAGCALLCLAQVVDLFRGWGGGSLFGWLSILPNRAPGGLVPPEAPIDSGASALALAFILVLVVLAVGLARTKDLRQYLGASCSTIFAIFYVGLMLSWLVPLRYSLAVDAAGPVPARYLVFFLFSVIWAGDISAYLVGRGVGRRLLFPQISPKKTLEGSLGGLAGSLLVAWVLARWWWHTPRLGSVMLLAGVVALAGQAGDLVESALKRSAEVKDAGALLPGHGGLLDRVDSLIFGAPVMWLCLMLMRALNP